MDAKKMFLALVLIATFAVIPSLATFEKDFISSEAIQAILNKSPPLSDAAMNALLKSKIIISNPVIEEAFFKNSNGLNGGEFCRESCYRFPCRTGGCSCKGFGCYKNSLDN